MPNKIKTVAVYALILAAGLGSGYVLSLAPALFKSNYTEGNYAAYFPNAQAKVVLYGTDWCGYCAKTRAYFKENKIEFVDLDIEKSPDAKKAHEALGGGGVPVVLIGNRKIQGFNAGALEAAFCWLSLRHGQVPPHVWDGEADPVLPALQWARVGEPLEKTCLMSNSFAFGGNNVSLIIGEAP